ncbi:MAG: type II secretion system protein GspL [Phycisphaerae bacterium]|nr:type II secretion system protein GspL [Phycisphaerae bacterium]MDD5380371.1 type II secretion system protein GspL [Phycisphaerae bacterium]
MFRFLKNSSGSGVPVLRRIAELPGAISRILSSAKWTPIGMDIGNDALTAVQFERNKRGAILVAAGSKNRPVNIEFGSSNWQRWAIEAIRELTTGGRFHGRDVIAAMPASEVFIDHMKMPKIEKDKLEDALFSKIKQKLPFEADDAMIKYLPAEDDNVMVVAVERKKIDRHLAIYEEANLQIKSIAVWPTALTNNYVRFFGRRKTDVEAIVMLLNIDTSYTNVVICRHKNPLFACSIPVGTKQLRPASNGGATDEMTAKLVLELTGCRRRFGLMYEDAHIERLIFLSHTIDRDVCTTIAKQMEMPAQMGDCLTAVEEANVDGLVIDRRGCEVNWATAFGLSLS